MLLRRRDFLKSSTLPIAMSALPFSLSNAQSLGERKNVLLIIADDLGIDVGIYDNPVVQTPCIDRLAKEGTRFTHAFVTTSSCSSSRSVIYSGLYPHTTGQWGLAGRSNVHSYSTIQSVPALLQAHGYRTALIGKYHVLPQEIYPFEEHFTGYQGNRNTAAMAQTAEEFLHADDGRPFFLVVCPADPHRDPSGGFANHQAYPGLTPVLYEPTAIPLPHFMADLPEVRQDVAEYYQSISRLDAGIGMLLDKLSQSGLAYETLVIFTSDNGAPFPGAKVNLYDPGVRVPLIVKSPLQKKRDVVHRSMVSLLDIAPTILDWVGVQSPHILPGKSLLSALEEHSQAGWNEVYFSHMFHGINRPYFMRGRRTYRYKLIWNIMHYTPFIEAGDVQRSAMWNAINTKEIDNIGGRFIGDYIYRQNIEFYDVRNDPYELNNLAEDPSFSNLIRNYMNKIVKMMESTNDEPRLNIIDYYKNLDILLGTAARVNKTP